MTIRHSTWTITCSLPRDSTGAPHATLHNGEWLSDQSWGPSPMERREWDAKFWALNDSLPETRCSRWSIAISEKQAGQYRAVLCVGWGPDIEHQLEPFEACEDNEDGRFAFYRDTKTVI